MTVSKLTVTRDTEGTKGITDMPIKDVWFMQYDRDIKGIVVYTSIGTYYTPGTIKYWFSSLKNSGFAFIKVDRSTIINTKNVVTVNSLYKEAFFETDPNKKSIRCEIANHRFEEVCKILQAENPMTIFA